MCEGIVNRFSADHSGGGDSERRLESLASFQAMILRHAMSFPSVRHVVYSTCSVYERENELVVSDVLSRCRGAFQLVDVASSLGLPCRGNSAVFPGAEKCVRMTPESARTNGFFIARFERCGSKDGARTVRDLATNTRHVGLDGKLEASAYKNGRVSGAECLDSLDSSKQRRKRRRNDGAEKMENQAAKKKKQTLSAGAKMKNHKQKRSRRRGGKKAVTA